MRHYTAVIQAVFEAETEVDALLIADTIRENGQRDLELEAGDSLDVIGVNQTSYSTRTALVWYLRQTRDLLIRTKIRDCFDHARELDKLAWIFEHKAEEHFDASGYSYGDFMDRARQLIGGDYDGVPNDSEA